MEVGNRYVLAVYLMLGIAVVAGVITLLVIEKSRRHAWTTDNIDAVAGSEWNDFTSPVFHPTAIEAKAHCVPAVLTSERASALCHIARMTTSRLRTPDNAIHLLPLRGWQGANTFLVRRKVGAHWLQFTDGGGKASLAVCAVDGSPLLVSSGDRAAAIKSLAREWLPDRLQPIEFHLVLDAGRIATWTTADTIDSAGLQFGPCNCYYDGKTVKFEMPKLTPNSKSPVFPPYTFELKRPYNQDIR